jgi:hypothetical protein
MRSLETIFRCFYLYFASKSFAKFEYQCFRGKPSKLRGGGGKSKHGSTPIDHNGNPLSARQLSARGLGSTVRKSHVHYIEEETTLNDSNTTNNGSTIEEGSLSQGSSGGLGPLADMKAYMSPADEQMMHVMKGRESLLDELRYLTLSLSFSLSHIHI